MASEQELENQIKKLSSDELMVKLINYGVSVGPITGTTRPLFEKKLMRLMGVDKEANIESPENSESQDATSIKKSPKANGATVFYAVQIPLEARPSESALVFTDKKEALRLVKSYPGSRFKPFSDHKDAVSFSNKKPEVAASPKLPILKPDGKPLNEGSAYRGPKPQELVRLRKSIESSDYNTVRGLVWANPRYLINSGDTPSVLQEGFRYNALHVCAQKNQGEICKMLLDTLSDPSFLQLLYPDDTGQTRLNRINFITDLYLNMPDKGNNETPLHFACKFGHPDVVDVLLSHPRTDKSQRNRYNEQPEDVVCQRARNITQEVKDKIFELLEDHVYVPLLRSEDNSYPMQITDPMSPEQLTKLTSRQPSNTNSPKDMPFKVRAVAGPMSPVQAQQFKRNWVTPPSPKPSDKRKIAEIRRSDYEKGLERIGRMIAKEMDVTWMEYWQFLDSFIDISKEEGLQKLEKYLSNQADKINCGAASSKQLSALEQQLNQLNLSDSGEDSGIENNKDHKSPPPIKKSIIKLPSPRSPLPKLVFYTKTPPKVVQNKDERRQCSPPNKREGAKQVLQFTKDSVDEENKDGGIVLSNQRSNEHSNETTTMHTSVVTTKRICDHGDSTDNSIRSCSFNSDASPNVSQDIAESYSNSNSDSLNTICNSSVESLEKTIEDTSVFESNSNLVNEGNPSVSLEPQIVSSVNKVEAFLHQLPGTETNSPGLHISDVDKHRGDRQRRSSTCSDASTTSDMSTASFHTCREDVSSDSEENDDEYMDFDELANTTIGSEMQLTQPQFFINGKQPSKEDIDVFRALETTPVSPDDYPHVAKWKDTLLSYSEEDRNSWSSPGRRSRTPHRLYVPTSNPGSAPQMYNSPAWQHTRPMGTVSSPECTTNIRSNLLQSFNLSVDNQPY